MSNSAIKFWTLLTMMCLGASALILMIDLGIKASILEESGRLRLAIADERMQRDGRNPAEANDNRASSNGSGPDHVLDTDAAGMETRIVRKSDSRDAPNSSAKRRANAKPASGTGEVPE